MMPEDAEQRLLDGCKTLGNFAEKSGVSQWEIVAGQDYGIKVEIERGRVSLAAGGGDGGFGIRVVDGGRYGYAYLGRPEDGESAVNQALEIARRSPKIDGFSLQTDEGSTIVEEMFFPEVDSLTSTDLLTTADDLLTITEGICPSATLTGGGVSAGISAGAILTSEGIEDCGTRSGYSISTQTSIDSDDLLTSGWSGRSSRKILQNPEEIIEEALWWTTETRKTSEKILDVGDYPVIFTDSGVGGLFATIVPQATLGDRQARGESFWAGKSGQTVMEDHLSLIDDRTMCGGNDSSGRDAEGKATRVNKIVENGKLGDALWSTRDAAEQISLGNVSSAESTASATRDSYESPPHPSAANLTITSSQKTLSRESMIENIGEGFLIGSVMGAHTANPTSGDFSVTTSHIMRIENGEIVGSLRQAGISGNLPRSLCGNVILGDLPKPHGGWGGGSVYVPDMLLHNGIRINPA